MLCLGHGNSCEDAEEGSCPVWQSAPMKKVLFVDRAQCLHYLGLVLAASSADSSAPRCLPAGVRASQQGVMTGWIWSQISAVTTQHPPAQSTLTRPHFTAHGQCRHAGGRPRKHPRAAASGAPRGESARASRRTGATSGRTPQSSCTARCVNTLHQCSSAYPLQVPASCGSPFQVICTLHLIAMCT